MQAIGVGSAAGSRRSVGFESDPSQPLDRRRTQRLRGHRFVRTRTVARPRPGRTRRQLAAALPDQAGGSRRPARLRGAGGRLGHGPPQRRLQQLDHLARRPAAQGLGGQGLGVFQPDAADHALDLRQLVRRHAELADPQAQEEHRVERLAPHRPADGGRDPVLAGGFDHHGDQAQDGGVRGGIQLGDGLVGPVHGQGVLDQVVGSDGEEIHLLRQVIGHQGGGGYLDHDADRYLLGDRRAPRPGARRRPRRGRRARPGARPGWTPGGTGSGRRPARRRAARRGAGAGRSPGRGARAAGCAGPGPGSVSGAAAAGGSRRSCRRPGRASGS